MSQEFTPHYSWNITAHVNLVKNINDVLVVWKKALIFQIPWKGLSGDPLRVCRPHLEKCWIYFLLWSIGSSPFQSSFKGEVSHLLPTVACHGVKMARQRPCVFFLLVHYQSHWMTIILMSPGLECWCSAFWAYHRFKILMGNLTDSSDTLLPVARDVCLKFPWWVGYALVLAGHVRLPWSSRFHLASACLWRGCLF